MHRVGRRLGALECGEERLEQLSHMAIHVGGWERRDERGRHAVLLCNMNATYPIACPRFFFFEHSFNHLICFSVIFTWQIDI